MTINENISLFPVQSVANTGQAINSGFNKIMAAQENNRQNQLLNLKASQMNKDNAFRHNQAVANQNHQNALLNMKQSSMSMEQEKHQYQMDSVKGSMLHKAFKGLKNLDPESRAAQIELMKDGLRAHGFDDDDWDQLATDEGLEKGLQYFSQFAPTPKEAKVGRFRQFTGEDGKTYKLDTASGDFEVIAEAQPIDLSTLPPEAREMLANQPAEVQKKAVESFANATAMQKRREAEAQKEKAESIKQEGLRIVEDLLSDKSQIHANVGSFDSFTPSMTDGAIDFDNKLETLKSLLTAENLGLMSGVLSESDLKIIADIGSGELNKKGSEREFISALERLKGKLGGVPVEGEDELEGLLEKYGN